jgi:hypothetical protein
LVVADEPLLRPWTWCFLGPQIAAIPGVKHKELTTVSMPALLSVWI